MCAARRDENARTIKPNDPLFRPRIIPARASCHEELRQAETNEGPPSHPLYPRKGEIISRVFCDPPPTTSAFFSSPRRRRRSFSYPWRAGAPRDTLDELILDTETFAPLSLFTGRVNEFYIRSRLGTFVTANLETSATQDSVARRVVRFYSILYDFIGFHGWPGNGVVLPGRFLTPEFLWS